MLLILYAVSGQKRLITGAFLRRIVRLKVGLRPGRSEINKLNIALFGAVRAQQVRHKTETTRDKLGKLPIQSVGDIDISAFARMRHQNPPRCGSWPGSAVSVSAVYPLSHMIEESVAALFHPAIEIGSVIRLGQLSSGFAVSSSFTGACSSTTRSAKRPMSAAAAQGRSRSGTARSAFRRSNKLIQPRLSRGSARAARVCADPDHNHIPGRKVA